MSGIRWSDLEQVFREQEQESRVSALEKEKLELAKKKLELARKKEERAEQKFRAEQSRREQSRNFEDIVYIISILISFSGLLVTALLFLSIIYYG